MNHVKYQSEKKTHRLVERLSDTGYFNKTIAIYGIGSLAKTITAELTEARIAGLMDKDPNNLGKEIYGFRVLSNIDVIRSVDAIVIASSDIYWETIFKRISFLKTEYGKEIFFTNGEIATSEMVDESSHENPYWNTSIFDLKRKIDLHEIVSFDIFDTLICRKLARPEDLLSLVEERVQHFLMSNQSIIQVRKEAEELCLREGNSLFNIHEVYHIIAETCGILKKQVSWLKDLEIEVEIECAVARSEMVNLFNYAIQRNKQVYLISDFHIPSEILKRILDKAGISGYTDLLVSCDEKKSKINGALWEEFRNRIRRRSALHIGDNDKADIVNSGHYGISSFKIMSCGDMLLASSLREFAIDIKSLQDSKIMGLIQQHLFNSPFALNNTKGRVEINNLTTFGYCILGPLIYNYFAWLIPQLEKGSFDRVLFLAREGYLLEKLYAKISNILHLKRLPEGVYFRTSRRMASVASIRTVDDIFLTLQDSFSGSAKELLNNRFGVVCSEEDSQEILVNTDPKIKDIVRKYADVIKKNALEERQNYLNYIKRIGISSKHKLAISDIGIKGSIQYYLGKIMDTEMVGYYLTGFAGVWNPYGLGHRVKALYPEPTSGDRGSSNIFKFHIMFESALVAPEGMYIKANCDGTFVNGPLFANQRLFETKSALHRGIETFILHMFAINDNKLGTMANPTLVDKLYGLPMSGKCLITEEVKKTFYVDELFGAASEKTIWE